VSASSFTRLAAFLSRQEASAMVRNPTETSNSPSILMRMAPGDSPRLLRVEYPGYDDLRVVIFLLVAPSYRERAMLVGLVAVYDAITVASNVD
jgi:hypothetical protein